MKTLIIKPMALTMVLFFLSSFISINKIQAEENNFNQASYPDTSGFKADSILKNATLVDDYIRIVKHPDYWNNTFVGKSRPSNIWTRAVFYEGHMALYNVHKDTALFNYAYNWGKFFNWQMAYKLNTTTDGDNQCCSQTYLELYKLKPEQAMITTVKSCLDYNINTKKNNYWTWIDTIQMSMPVYALLGQVTGNSKYFDYMYRAYKWTRDTLDVTGLYNKKDGLWWRDKDFNPPMVNANGKQVYWSRGNGWVYAALVRVLSFTPENEKHYSEYRSDFLAMSEALLKCQREDGFWNPSLADPDEYGGKETSGTALFVYGMAWGINNGLLDTATYLTAVKKGWKAMSRDAIHSDGKIGWMQGTGKQPSDDQPLSYEKMPNFEDYGTGCVLLAAAESYKLAINLEKSGKPNDLSNNDINKPSVVSSAYSLQICNSPFSVIRIYDISGNCQISKYTSDSNNYTIETGQLPEGVYIARIIKNGKSYDIKFVKP
jgi:rhamnogalacturonyl hydrolase YesR